MSKATHDHLFKILILGDSSVGKSCILTRFAEDSFNFSFMPTIGIDFKIKTIEIKGKKIKLTIWDTAGQERFNNITESYYRTARGVFFVYDITNGQSFDNIAKWLRNLEANTGDSEVVKYILGNKCDLNDLRVIDYVKGVDMAANFNLKFHETSAKEDINIQKVFYDIARDLTEQEENNNSSFSASTQRINITNGQSSENSYSNSYLNAKCCQ